MSLLIILRSRFESEQLVREVMNGNNLALVSTRRMGKQG